MMSYFSVILISMPKKSGLLRHDWL